MVRYKCCENVVVFLAFRYVALALALGVVALLTSLLKGGKLYRTMTSLNQSPTTHHTITPCTLITQLDAKAAKVDCNVLFHSFVC